MTYVLYNRKEEGTPHVIKRYETHRGAMIGMRAANRNAGWTRTSLTSNGIYEQEWCVRKENGRSLHDYAPYVIASEYRFEEKYGLNELVPVVNLMSGNTVMIPRKDRGSCVDPSMEVYWSY